MADLPTKHLDRGKLDKSCKMLGYDAMEGVDRLTLNCIEEPRFMLLSKCFVSL